MPKTTTALTERQFATYEFDHDVKVTVMLDGRDSNFQMPLKAKRIIRDTLIIRMGYTGEKRGGDYGQNLIRFTLFCDEVGCSGMTSLSKDQECNEFMIQKIKQAVKDIVKHAPKVGGLTYRSDSLQLLPAEPWEIKQIKPQWAPWWLKACKEINGPVLPKPSANVHAKNAEVAAAAVGSTKQNIRNQVVPREVIGLDDIDEEDEPNLDSMCTPTARGLKRKRAMATPREDLPPYASPVDSGNDRLSRVSRAENEELKTRENVVNAFAKRLNDLSQPVILREELEGEVVGSRNAEARKSRPVPWDISDDQLKSPGEGPVRKRRRSR